MQVWLNKLNDRGIVHIICRVIHLREVVPAASCVLIVRVAALQSKLNSSEERK